MAHNDRLIFSDAKRELDILLREKDSVVITDLNVMRLYKEKLFGKARVITLPVGERSKNLRTVGRIYSELIRFGCDRKSVIVAVGGGVVCDTAGFAAATFKRGTGLVLVPTTLLAQADAAIGGKNGVNADGFKNLAGTFRQPDRIVIDTAFLRTLDEKNFNNGAAEIIKTAAIYDSAFFGRLENKILSEMPENKLKAIIKKTVSIKNSIVKNDFEEKGLRKILNFGHTIGHALELNRTRMRHGEAVSAGMAAACKMSRKLTGLSEQDAKRLTDLLKVNRLPVTIPAEISAARLIDSILQDKKKSGGYVDFVLLKRIGDPVIRKTAIGEMEELINDFR